MTGTTVQQPSGEDGTELPSPRRGSRWRWSPPRRALVARGALAAVLGLGVATSTAAGAGAATTAGNTGAAAKGRPPGGPGRLTVAGKVTALSGDDITVRTKSDASVTVVALSSTTFKAGAGPGGGTAPGVSALKVGDFVGVQGTRNRDGTVTASTVLIGRPPGAGRGDTNGAGPPPSGAPSA